MSTEIAEILEAAADQFESGQVGWGTGAYEVTGSYHRDENGKVQFTPFETPQYCAVGIVRKVMRDRNPAVDPLIADHAAWVVAGHISQSLNLPVARFEPGAELLKLGRQLPKWNDERGRTKEEVIEAFKLAAKDVRNAA